MNGLDKIEDLCQRLAMGTMATQLTHVSEEAARCEWSYQEFFERLLLAENVIDKNAAEPCLHGLLAFRRSRR